MNRLSRLKHWTLCASICLGILLGAGPALAQSQCEAEDLAEYSLAVKQDWRLYKQGNFRSPSWSAFLTS